MQLLDVLRANLKRYRQLKGWNQGDLAGASGFSREHIARIESAQGGSWVSAEFIVAVAHALDVAESDLFTDHEKRPPLQLDEVIEFLRGVAGDAAAARYLVDHGFAPKQGSAEWREMARLAVAARQYKPSGDAEPIELLAREVTLRAAEPSSSPFKGALLERLAALDDPEAEKLLAMAKSLPTKRARAAPVANSGHEAMKENGKRAKGRR